MWGRSLSALSRPDGMVPSWVLCYRGVCACVLLGGGPWDAMGCQHALLAWCHVCMSFRCPCVGWRGGLASCIPAASRFCCEDCCEDWVHHHTSAKAGHRVMLLCGVCCQGAARVGCMLPPKGAEPWTAKGVDNTCCTATGLCVCMCGGKG